MIVDIVKGISRALYETFGEGYTIYKDDVPQNFKEPCFSITLLRGTTDAKLPNRYFMHNLFDIHYFPESELNARSEMLSVVNSLFLSLEYINVLDNLCRGTKMSYEIIDGVLHFFVNYDLFVLKNDGAEKPSMNTLEQTSTLEENNG